MPRPRGIIAWFSGTTLMLLCGGGMVLPRVQKARKMMEMETMGWSMERVVATKIVMTTTMKMTMAIAMARTSPLYPAVLWEYHPHLNESSREGGGKGEAARCQPTLSCYVGGSEASKSMVSGGRLTLVLIGAARWCFDAFVWWENYHVEHHDFPDIPLSLLPRLRWDLAAPMYDSLVCR